LVDRGRGKTEKKPNTVPQTKPGYSEDSKREVLAHMASTGQTLNPPAPISGFRPTA
jgi:hypothetical protein